ncbi:MAG: hypothetical protein WCD76_17375 [Pyrinomonadaceae bacterium]
MSFPKIRLVVAALTFVFGASLDDYMRSPSGETTDCYCTSAKCRIVFITDHPIASLTHPVEIYDMIATARWLD